MIYAFARYHGFIHHGKRCAIPNGSTDENGEMQWTTIPFDSHSKYAFSSPKQMLIFNSIIQYLNNGILAIGTSYTDQPKIFWDMIKWNNFVERSYHERERDGK